MLNNKCYVGFKCSLDGDYERQNNCKYCIISEEGFSCRFLGMYGDCMNMHANLEVIHEIAHLHDKKFFDCDERELFGINEDAKPQDNPCVRLKTKKATH